jgi:hypothetical protein|tara:strand:+ start:398 stop:1402 length:1005 start_codon:yes stop_codon:yes gene_type:complete
MSYIFISKVSTSVRLIENGEQFDQQLTGVIGDFIGGVIGTVWSFAGVILFFLALRLQSKELNLQLEEMKSTRNVFQVQQFENTFFNLLKTQNDIRQSTELREENFNHIQGETNTTYFNGNAAFEKIKGFINQEKEKLDKNIKVIEYILSDKCDWEQEKKNEEINDFKDYYTTSYEKLDSNPSLKSKAVFKLAYNQYSNQLSHYFRNLYHILLYIKENEELELSQNFQKEFTGEKVGIYINNENIKAKKIRNKYKKYSHFLQAQMSGTELFLLFYNVLFFKKAKKLVQYYDLIENLNVDDLLYPELDTDFYQEYEDGLELIPKSDLKKRDEMLKI